MVAAPGAEEDHEAGVSVETLKRVIVEVAQRRVWLSFAELPGCIAGGWDATRDGPALDLRGHSCIEIAPNVLLWSGMSEQLAEAVLGLIREKRLFTHPSCALTYLIDGGGLALPIPKRSPPPGGLKKLHWIPTCLRLVPMAGKKRAKKASQA